MSKKGIKKDGRPPGSGKYKEQTKPIRIPLTLVPYIEVALNDYSRMGKSMLKNKYDLFTDYMSEW